MQVLYAMNRDSGLTTKKALFQYNHNINQSYDLYLFNLHQLIKAAEYSLIVKKRIQGKLRPTEKDLAYQPVLAENELTESIVDARDLDHGKIRDGRSP